MDDAWIGGWAADRVLGVPLVVATAVIHVLGLGLINGSIIRGLPVERPRQQCWLLLASAVGTAALAATILHAVEAGLCAPAYLAVGAAPDSHPAMLHSSSAMTTYGHSSIVLDERWRMPGAIEALSGMLLFVLTTAFMVSAIEKVWPLGADR